MDSRYFIRGNFLCDINFPFHPVIGNKHAGWIRGDLKVGYRLKLGGNPRSVFIVHARLTCRQVLIGVPPQPHVLLYLLE